MTMFGRDYDFSLIKTSSKEALLRSALMASNNDIRKASEICEFVTKVLPNMPDTDPIAPSSFEQMRDTAVQLIDWGREHEDQIVGVVNMVRKFMNKEQVTNAAKTADVIFKEL